MDYEIKGTKIIYIPSKNVYLDIDSIKTFVKNRERILVGFRVTDLEDCFIWEDETYVNIECFKLTKEDFRKEYINLIKKLKIKQNESSKISQD